MGTLVQAAEHVVQALDSKLQAHSTSLPEKYRTLFSLRNLAGKSATDALINGAEELAVLQTCMLCMRAVTFVLPTVCAAAALQDKSDLFRHDVAFCLGQRQDATAVEVLKQLVADPQEHPM
jgi:deoxyhypusine monooxygenase